MGEAHAAQLRSGHLIEGDRLHPGQFGKFRVSRNGEGERCDRSDLNCRNRARETLLAKSDTPSRDWLSCISIRIYLQPSFTIPPWTKSPGALFAGFIAGGRVQLVTTWS
jgi:hypothetical protein